MIINFNQSLSQCKRMYQHQPLIQIERYPIIRLPYVLERIQQHIVRILIVPKLLLLLCNVDRDLDRLFDIADRPIQLERPLRLFRLIIDLAEQIVNEFMSECLDLDLGHHFNHIRYHLLSLGYVKLQGLVVLLTLLVVLGCSAPLRLALVVLGDSQVLV